MLCHISAYSGTSGSIIKNIKMWYLINSEQGKKQHNLCEGGIEKSGEKSVPCDHRLSFFGNPRDAKP